MIFTKIELQKFLLNFASSNADPLLDRVNGLREKGKRSMFNGSSEVYKRIRRQYVEYVQLYSFFNNGSSQGIIPFDQFYWRMVYRIQYADASKVGSFH